MRVAIAGGGTGGHISPAIAVAEALGQADPAVQVDFLGTPRPVDARMYARFGDAFHVLHPPRIDRGLLGRLLLPFSATAALAEARGLLRRLSPDILFATGGYPSFFPVVAARTLGIPGVIHESNSVPGKANLLASRFATLVLTGFHSAASAFSRPVVFTGNPVRSSLTKMDRREARKMLGLAPEGRTVLILGGSQGAAALNRLGPVAPPGIEVLLQCGSREEESTRKACAGMDNVKVLGFMDDVSPLYSSADLAVARAGAMTVAELQWFRVPSILVPYPSAAGDHQRINAEEAVSRGGARVILQDHLPDELWPLVGELLDDSRELTVMKEALEEGMRRNPADDVAEKLIELARVRSEPVGSGGRNDA